MPRVSSLPSQALTGTVARKPWKLIYTLSNPNGYSTSASDQFGWKIAASSSYIVVTAPFEADASGTNSGKVYVFDTAGTYLRTIDNPNAYGTSSNDRFGERGVAVDGDYIVVPAMLEDPVAEGNGVVYVFSASTGSLLWTIADPNTGTGNLYGFGDRFGSSVAISGDYIVIGATGEQPSTEGLAGSAFLYRISTQTKLFEVTNPNGGTYADSFGNSVTVNSTAGIFAVGATYEDTGGTDSGAVYIYSIASGTLQQSVFGSEYAAWFGAYLTMNDSRIVVGSDRPEANLQKVRILNTSGSLLSTISNPTPYDVGYQDSFASAIGVSTNYVVVGAPYEDEVNNISAGKAYVYDLSTGSLIQILDNPTAYSTSYGDAFGTSVAAYGNYVYVGAPWEGDAGGSLSGKVYVFVYS